MAIQIRILDTAAFIALAKELGLIDAANMAISGDIEGAITLFTDNIGDVLLAQGLSNVLKIIFKYAVVKMVVNALPGTGKGFSFLGMEIKI